MGNGALAIGPKLPHPSSTLPEEMIDLKWRWSAFCGVAGALAQAHDRRAARIAATAVSPTTHAATAPCLRRGRLLPKVSGRGGAGLAGGPRGRSAAGRLFPRSLHAA